MSITQIEQIRFAHANARPNPTINPSWANCHFDCGVLLARIDALEKSLREATVCDSCGCGCHKVCANNNCERL